MPNWAIIDEAATTSPEPALTLEEQVAAERDLRLLAQEAYADLEQLYRDNVGWQRIGAESTQFTNEGRTRIAAIADVTATGNALIKSGVNLRIAYVWGQGVNVRVDDDGADGQDVNAVWQAFWDDPSNRAAFTASEAQARYERKLATGGETFWALPTDPRTGRVRVRKIAAKQITDRICDPEDEGTVWFFKRSYTAITIDPRTGERGTEQRELFHPALGFWPAVRPKTWQGKPVRWDAPVRHVAVNVPDEDWRGLGDVLAALPWARVDKEFLEDFAVYMKALTRILGTVSGANSRTARAAQTALNTATNAPGSWAATDPNTSLSLVSKSGAQIDADSHRPFATLVAAALEVPLTMLLGDPGVTGARATAETLDQPTELKFGLRREVHAELFRDIASYVIDMAVVAPAGALRGQVARDGDRLVVTLPEGDSRIVVVDWPEYDSTPLKDLVEAIVKAAETEALPMVEILKLLAAAFELEDVDDLVDQMTDDDGNWLDPRLTAADAAVQRFRRGEDPGL